MATAGQDPPPTPADELDQLDRHTAALVATVADLSAHDLAGASLCRGWTRGHVVAHVARNADALGNLAHWARTGERREMYPGGPASRDAEIEAGSHRGPQEQLDDLRDTADRLRPRLAELVADGPAVAEVEGRGGVVVASSALAFMRLREVVFHHADLGCGFTFEQVDAGLLGRFIDDAVRRLRGSDLSVRLETDGRRWDVGDALTTVSGTPAALLRWLARQDPSGVTSGDALPIIPEGN